MNTSGLKYFQIVADESQVYSLPWRSRRRPVRRVFDI